MKNVFRLCFLMIVVTQTIAQNNLPPAYELNSDTGMYVTIDDRHWQMLEDKKGEWTIEQVKQPPVSDDFHANYSKVDGVNYRIHFYWFRYRLKNTTNKAIEVVLLNIAQADQTDVFLFDEGKSFHYTTGILYPIKRKDGLKKINGIPIQIDPGKELIVYNRIKNNYYFNKPKYWSVSIGFTKEVIRQEYIDNDAGFSRRDFDALFVGILLFAGIFNLFFYSIVRDRVYLYYALFLFYFSFDTDLLAHVIFPNQPSILYTIEHMIWSSGIFLFVQFIRFFLKTFDRFPLWDMALKSIALAHPIVSIGRFFIEPYLLGKWSGLLTWASYFPIRRGSLYDPNYIFEMHKEFNSIFEGITGVCRSGFHFLVLWFWSFVLLRLPS